MDTKTIQRLSGRQRRLFDLLSDGGKHSVADLSVHTHYSDPRGHIRKLQNKGVPVRDEWRTAPDGVRYKVYFIPEAQEGL